MRQAKSSPEKKEISKTAFECSERQRLLMQNEQFLPQETGQLGFDALLQDAAQNNAAREFDRETAHLPDSWAEAVDCHRHQISDHHAAMLSNDSEAAFAIRKDAHLLAAKLNGGRHGILADDDAPGCRLARAAAATPGSIPLWGRMAILSWTPQEWPCGSTWAACLASAQLPCLFLGFRFGRWTPKSHSSAQQAIAASSAYRSNRGGASPRTALCGARWNFMLSRS